MNATFIVDCSLCMAWCFADEATADTDALLNRLATEAVLVPQHWALEVANVLAMAERRGRISAADATRFVTLLALSTFKWMTKPRPVPSTRCCRLRVCIA